LISISETRGSRNDGLPQELNVSKAEIEHQAMKKLEKELIEVLTKIGIIGPDYRGEVIFHFPQGGFSDRDQFEKSIRKRLEKKCK
jgi:hypothetical protein